MSEDEAQPEEEELDEDIPLKSDSPTNDNNEEDLAHEKEDLEELEAARKERMDLMASELKTKKGLQEKVVAKKSGDGGEEGEEGVQTFDKFQYLIGQSEVFAHFLAGKLYSLFDIHYIHMTSCLARYCKNNGGIMYSQSLTQLITSLILLCIVYNTK